MQLLEAMQVNSGVENDDNRRYMEYKNTTLNIVLWCYSNQLTFWQYYSNML